MEHTVLIALGTNLGDRFENLAQARRYLSKDVAIVAESSIYETAPWGYTDQPDFLNQVVRGKARLSPLALLGVLKRIEAKMGREETFRYGPRLIDLDLLLVDQLVIQTQELTLPHPQLHKRAFVLIPLAEVAGEWVHPLLGRTMGELAQEIDPQGVTKTTGNEVK